MSAGLIIVWLLGRTLLASAQTSNATCSVAQKWASNSQQQSPCLVASSLLAVCTGSYDVFALPEGWHYNGPSIQDANPCQCNTVVYSLLSECGLCQNRTVVMWSVWETNCASVSIGSFPKPIPAGLHVPGWAYLDVKATDMFNESLALANTLPNPRPFLSRVRPPLHPAPLVPYPRLLRKPPRRRPHLPTQTWWTKNEAMPLEAVS
ncbi:hypothetical protein C8R43DRAFT_83280 [Mycena crocata]|nr:hypothetical protein C8R43DRAFT_83280 [Mycena crocata]